VLVVVPGMRECHLYRLNSAFIQARVLDPMLVEKLAVLVSSKACIIADVI
jgi:hypothetical protein